MIHHWGISYSGEFLALSEHHTLVPVVISPTIELNIISVPAVCYSNCNTAYCSLLHGRVIAAGPNSCSCGRTATTAAAAVAASVVVMLLLLH